MSTGFERIEAKPGVKISRRRFLHLPGDTLHTSDPAFLIRPVTLMHATDDTRGTIIFDAGAIFRSKQGSFHKS
ncbi:hypothetical protein M407DRAFT_16871 [Tulasnella calospora MUT 4182]|uniref:Uncharacterized protein n=1 Tax=Tulasnella calospora MUT 4182 TaxID=1051891 RepID=A0A0C3QYK2_9AGAM|nr:hypothetical protein M407DRAFT_16871 [Tulasnella calospora MUT 4182]